MEEKIRQLESQLIALELDPSSSHISKIDVMVDLAWILRDIDPNRSLQLSQDAYHASLQAEYESGLACSLRNMSVLNSMVFGRSELALEQAREALLINRNESDLRFKAQVLGSVACVYTSLADYPRSLNYYFEVIELSEQSGDVGHQAAALNDMGVIYACTDDYGQALETYHRALELAREHNIPRVHSSTLVNIADALSRLERHAEAESFIRRALRLSRIHNFKTSYAIALNNLGDVYAGRGEFLRAVRLIHRAIDILSEYGDTLSQAELLSNLAGVYQRQGWTDAAVLALQKAIQINSSLGGKNQLVQCHKLMAEIYEKQGDYSQALAHYKEFHTIREDVFSDRAAQHLKAVQVLNQFEKARQEAEIYRLRNVELQREIEERRKVEQTLSRMAQTDPLTGVSNRRHFVKVAEAELDCLNGRHQPLSVIMMDLDDFKQVNDRFGHAVGDQVLIEVAERIKRCLRKTDVLARYGGDEFVILLPGTDRVACEQIVRRLHAQIGEFPIPVSKGLVQITPSIGALTPEEPAEFDLDHILEKADQALYRAKLTGKDQAHAWRQGMITKVSG